MLVDILTLKVMMTITCDNVGNLRLPFQNNGDWHHNSKSIWRLDCAHLTKGK